MADEISRNVYKKCTWWFFRSSLGTFATWVGLGQAKAGRQHMGPIDATARILWNVFIHTHTHMCRVCLVSAYCRHLPFRLPAWLFASLFLLLRLPTGSNETLLHSVCLPVCLFVDQQKPWRQSFGHSHLCCLLPFRTVLVLSLPLSVPPSLSFSLILGLAKCFEHCANFGCAAAPTHTFLATILCSQLCSDANYEVFDENE